MKRKEADLYEPVKSFFSSRGLTVRGEVLHCDLVALDADDTVYIVELKTSCSLTVILQAIARLNVSHFVYIAIPQPSKRQQPHWRELLKLCEMTGIGLLTVTFLRDCAFVTEQVCARRSTERVNKKRSAQLLHETRARLGDFNVGGTTKTKRITAYRQLSLLCVAEMAKHGPRTPKQLRQTLLQDKVPALLQSNVYQWFIRISKGLYDLSDYGRQALLDYAHVLREIQPLEYNNE